MEINGYIEKGGSTPEVTESAFYVLIRLYSLYANVIGALPTNKVDFL